MSEQHDNEKPKKEFKLHRIFGTLPLEDEYQSPAVKAFRVFAKIIDGPTTWFREQVVEKCRGPPYPYYHRKFAEVPTIDKCYSDDYACVYEANEKYKRDMKVDFEIIKILKQRYYRCTFYERVINEWENIDKMCLKERDDMELAKVNLFIKYGELGPTTNVVHAFMKQKHRLIWERRQKEKESQQALA